jgi:hypothetical protein
MYSSSGSGAVFCGRWKDRDYSTAVSLLTWCRIVIFQKYLILINIPVITSDLARNIWIIRELQFRTHSGANLPRRGPGIKVVFTMWRESAKGEGECTKVCTTVRISINHPSCDLSAVHSRAPGVLLFVGTTKQSSSLYVCRNPSHYKLPASSLLF